MTAPTPMLVAVDLVIRRGSHVLLIKRRNDPYQSQFALPGGFVEPGETVEDAAARELKEETGVEIGVGRLRLINVYSAPDRDPRGRVLSIAFYVEVPDGTRAVAGDDAASTEWVLFDDASGNPLAFDHNNILASAWWQYWPKSWVEREYRTPPASPVSEKAE